MEKSRTEILSEIQETLAELKARIAELEERLSSIEPAEEPEEATPVAVPVEDDMPEPVEIDVAAEEDLPEPIGTPAEYDAPGQVEAPVEDMTPIDISIDIEEVGFPEEAAEPEAPAAPAAPAVAPERAPAPAPEPVIEPVIDSNDEEGLLLDGAVQPKASINDRQERKVKKAVMDVMGQKLAWKTAMPGTPVKNVISAISLNDRVLFINTLFKEDPMAFQETISAFNAMSSFDEAEEYVRSHFPDWNLNSDQVFRLMMAVRRKLK